MSNSLIINLNLSETRTIWELLAGENNRIKEKLAKSPNPLPYWIEKKEEVEELLNRFNEQFKIQD